VLYKPQARAFSLASRRAWKVFASKSIGCKRNSTGEIAEPTKRRDERLNQLE